MESYKDKVIAITGSATGIGFALAKKFGSEGARIVVSGLESDGIDDAVSKLSALGIEAIGRACDVTIRQDVEALADAAWEHFGHVDVIINNAGVSQAQSPLIEMDIERFRKVLEVNLYGVLNGIQVFGKRFLQQESPAGIYNLGSENSLYPCVPSAHAYVSSKHSVLAITEMLAEEVPSHIEVALILPGLVRSNMTSALGIGMDTDEFAATVVRQLKAGEFYIVSHAYNQVRLQERYEKINAAFERNAPRYEGDREFDIRTIVANLAAEHEASSPR